MIKAFIKHFIEKSVKFSRSFSSALIKKNSYPFLKSLYLSNPLPCILLVLPVWCILIIGGTNFAHTIFYILLFTIGVIVARALGYLVFDIINKNLNRKKIIVELASFSIVLLACIMLTNYHVTFKLLVAFTILVLIYTWLRSITQFAYIILSFAFNLVIFMGWFSVQNNINLIPILFYLAISLWHNGYVTLCYYYDIPCDIFHEFFIKFANYNKANLSKYDTYEDFSMNSAIKQPELRREESGIESVPYDINNLIWQMYCISSLCIGIIAININTGLSGYLIIGLGIYILYLQIEKISQSNSTDSIKNKCYLFSFNLYYIILIILGCILSKL